MAVYEKKTEHYDNGWRRYELSVTVRSPSRSPRPTRILLASISTVSDIIRSIIDRYSRRRSTRSTWSNEFKSVIAQRVVSKALACPKRLARDQRSRGDDRRAEGSCGACGGVLGVGVTCRKSVSIDEGFGTAEVDYIFDQSPQRLLRHLMPRYVTTQLFHAFLESVAAEHAARMTAMDSATTNAGEMIDALSLKMNRVRQAAITKEII
jgi:F-type H+-transporting ATPase subunit gamma